MVTLKEVLSFFNNPGRAWEIAFSHLGPAEQALLISVLDTGGSAEPLHLKAVYEEKIRGLTDALSFDECLRRVTHSFLSTAKSWDGRLLVDFEHPSVRDMLLHHLANRPEERKRYIRHASTTSLAAMIQALAAPSSEAVRSRFHLARTEGEVQQLIARLGELTEGTLEVSEWEAILRATLALVPAVKKGEHLKQVDSWLEGRGVAVGRERVASADLDLQAFADSPEGKVVEAVSRTLSRRMTWESNRRYTLSDWMKLLPIFYLFASYVKPVAYIEYLQDILGLLGEAEVEQRIRAANELIRVEPLAVRQVVSERVLDEWNEHVKSRVKGLVDAGLDLEERAELWRDDPFADDDLHQDYLDWTIEVENLFRIGDFYEWSGCERPDAWRDLKRLLSDLEIEDEQLDEDSDDGERDDSEAADYWTIDTMFADL